MEIRADLHVHTRFARSTSPRSTLDNYLRAANRKGLDLIASGDCLHPEVRKELSSLAFEDGLFSKDGISIVLECEVEDINGAHHLLFFPDLAKVEEFAETAGRYSRDMSSEGRPAVSLFGNDLAAMALDCEAAIGPAHYFTPYKGLLAIYGGIEQCYREYADKIKFVELGLSADSDMANPMSELRDRVFLTNSDAHSPSERRLGREFNLLSLDGLDYSSLIGAIATTNGGRKGNNYVMANFGLPPQKGRYHLTGCSSCYEKYGWKEAREKRRRCSCGGVIKKGVLDLAAGHHDLAGDELPRRPPYRYILPLTDMIAEVHGLSISSERIGEIYVEILERTGDELSLFTKDNVVDLIGDDHSGIARAVGMLKRREFEAKPGGGGEYGQILFPSCSDGDNTKYNKNEEGCAGDDEREKHLRTLFDF